MASLEDFETTNEKLSFLEGKAAAKAIWEGSPRIKSINIPGRRAGKMTYKALVDKMKKFTGTDKKQKPAFYELPTDFQKNIKRLKMNYMPPGNFQGFDPFAGAFEDEYKPEEAKLVLFYGFNGLLAHKYSIIEGMNREELTARMSFAGDKVPYSIKDYSEFRPVIEQMEGALSEITFDDAIIKMRVGIEKEAEEFDEGSEEEFDDNCEATCKPGSHTCGK